jgi:hypothetical protein
MSDGRSIERWELIKKDGLRFYSLYVYYLGHYLFLLLIKRYINKAHRQMMMSLVVILV